MQILTETEVAEILRCTKAALRRWRREGRGPRFIRVGRLIRYRLSDVEEFLEKNASTQGPGPAETTSRTEARGLRIN